MIFHVDPASPKPVYQQLIDQVKLAIASQRLRPADKLPTVRDLAVQLRVNRNTVARVYSELEREGVLYTRTGHGTFVSEQASPFSSAEQRRQLARLADDLIAQARLYGYDRQQITDFLEQRIEGLFRSGDQPGKRTRNQGGSK